MLQCSDLYCYVVVLNETRCVWISGVWCARFEQLRYELMPQQLLWCDFVLILAVIRTETAIAIHLAFGPTSPFLEYLDLVDALEGFARAIG